MRGDRATWASPLAPAPAQIRTWWGSHVRTRTRSAQRPGTSQPAHLSVTNLQLLPPSPSPPSLRHHHIPSLSSRSATSPSSSSSSGALHLFPRPVSFHQSGCSGVFEVKFPGAKQFCLGISRAEVRLEREFFGVGWSWSDDELVREFSREERALRIGRGQIGRI